MPAQLCVHTTALLAPQMNDKSAGSKSRRSDHNEGLLKPAVQSMQV